MAEQNPGKLLYPTGVCATIGVPQRTLHHCFQEYAGISAKRYLTLRRMHPAQRALRARTEAKTVTEVATLYGFWELGRFAVTYKSLFGESPSATVRSQ